MRLLCVIKSGGKGDGWEAGREAARVHAEADGTDGVEGVALEDLLREGETKLSLQLLGLAQELGFVNDGESAQYVF